MILLTSQQKFNIILTVNKMNGIDFEFALVYCRQIKQKIESKITEKFKRLNLTCSEGSYLFLFNNHDRLTLSEINLLMDVDKANTTRVVSSLIQKGLLDKTDDIRKYKLFLTGKGKKILNIILEEVRTEKDNILKNINENDLKCFKLVLKQILENLEG